VVDSWAWTRQRQESGTPTGFGDLAPCEPFAGHPCFDLVRADAEQALILT